MNVVDRIMDWINRLMKGPGRAAGEAGDVAQAGQLRMKVRNLEGEKKKLLTEIGEIVHDAHEGGGSYPDIASLCEEIDGHDEKIAEMKDEIERIKMETRGTEGATEERIDPAPGRRDRVTDPDHFREGGAKPDAESPSA